MGVPAHLGNKGRLGTVLRWRDPIVRIGRFPITITTHHHQPPCARKGYLHTADRLSLRKTARSRVALLLWLPLLTDSELNLEGRYISSFFLLLNRLDRQNCAGCLPAVGTYYIERYIPSIFIIFGDIRRYIQEVIITASISVVSKPCWVLVFRTFHPLPSPLFAHLRSTMYVTPHDGVTPGRIR